MSFYNNPLLLELHITDFEKAMSFYKRFGFEVVWARPPEGLKGYLVMKKEQNIICFWGGNDKVYEHPYFKKFDKSTPRGYAVELVLQVSDLEECYKIAKELESIVEEIETKPWGLKDFRLIDPFGFYLRFTEPHNILDNKYAVK